MNYYPAPELSGTNWFNTTSPIRLSELRGNIIILDFWTYCCINCMHVHPVLHQIESKYQGEPLAVIGVHSGKFDAEKNPQRIREAIERYGIKHPVVDDSDFSIWNSYGVRSWPTLVIIDPDGTIAAIAPGEPSFEILDSFIQSRIAQAKAMGTLSANSKLASVAQKEPASCLYYPGKVGCVEGGLLVVSDTGNNRIVIVKPDGEVQHVVGSGRRAMADGSFESCSFNSPQGTCYHQGFIYVADTFNHAIRRIDLNRKTVETVAGTGNLGSYLDNSRRPALETDLRSPWDLCSVDDVIMVAMAGSHQIWKFYPASGEIEVYAGTGLESNDDGNVATSSWSQPSGLAYHNGILYVADSETSSVRKIDLASEKVSTIVGLGLFDFGDICSTTRESRFQHCMDVLHHEGSLIVADSYNGKLKRIELENGIVSEVCGGLSEPGGVAIDDSNSIIVADTNSHRIIRLNGKHPEEIVLNGIEPVRQTEEEKELPFPKAKDTANWFTHSLKYTATEGFSFGIRSIWLELEAPEGFVFAEGSQVSFFSEVSRRSDVISMYPPANSFTCWGGSSLRLRLDIQVNRADEDRVNCEFICEANFVLCSKKDMQCVPVNLKASVPVVVQAKESEMESYSFKILIKPPQY